MKKTALLIFAFLIALNLEAREIKFYLESGNRNYFDCPVSFRISPEMNPENATALLFEISRSERIPLAIQEDPNETGFYWFVIEGEFPANNRKDFILQFKEDQNDKSNFNINIDQEKLEITQSGEKILHYRIADKYPPEGSNPLYKRSAYIHPLWTPGGEILTTIQPKDHLHHYGIWSPWTKTHIKDREIDYWNLAKGEGTVKHTALQKSYSGELFAGFSSLHEHIDFGNKGPDRVTMLETWNIRSWSTFSGNPVRIIDYHTNLYNHISDTIIFNAYRYGGGLAFRATAKWNKENCRVLTSEGKTRKDADGERARWCIIEGASAVKEGTSGILFLSHPFNYDHPEALRVWPEDAAGGTGELMFNYCPTRIKDWIIESGKNYQLNYRMIVYDGKMTVEIAEKFWNGFAYPPEVVFEEKQLKVIGNR